MRWKNNWGGGAAFLSLLQGHPLPTVWQALSAIDHLHAHGSPDRATPSDIQNGSAAGSAGIAREDEDDQMSFSWLHEHGIDPPTLYRIADCRIRLLHWGFRLHADADCCILCDCYVIAR